MAPGRKFHFAIFLLSLSPYFSNHVFRSPSGVFHASCSFLSHNLTMCRFCKALSLNSLRACWMARLLTSCMSPRLSFIVTQCFTAVKWTMSRASAWISVIGGTSGLRGDVGEPVIGRREKQKPGPLSSKLNNSARVFHRAGVSCL